MKKIFLGILVFSFLFGIVHAKELTVIYNFPAGEDNDVLEWVSVGDDVNSFSAFLAVAAEQGLEIDMAYYESFDSWFINGVNGVAGSSEQYWHFWVNGELSMQGISQHIPEAGDVLELGFADEPTDASVVAVNEALHWLVSHQNPDGEIGSHKVWGNAFSLMALNLSTNFSEAKQSAIDYLSVNQKTDAGFAYPGFDSDALHTAVSVMAFIANNQPVEDMTKTQTPMDFLISKQEADGGFSGWGESDSDTTSWVLMALVSAAHQIPSAAPTPLDFLFLVQGPDGGFSYSVGGASAVDYTATSLMALAASEYPQDSVIDNAISYINSQKTQEGCLINAYTTALGAMALRAYNQDNQPLLQCLLGMQLQDKGFGRDGESSNSVDTALAAIALSNETLPLRVLDSNPVPEDGVIQVESILQFTVSITNNGRAPATEIQVSLEGIPGAWVDSDNSTVFIPELLAGETKQAELFVEMKDIGVYTISASVSAVGVIGAPQSNALELDIGAADLAISIEQK